MTVLGEMKRDARRMAREQGHDLGRWVSGQALTMADCKRCGHTVFVDPQPFGNLPTISGAATTACPGEVLADKLRAALRERVIYTRTDYGSARSTAAYVRLYLFDRDEVDEITFEVARLLDESTHDGRGIQRGGGGYNRALDVLGAVARRVGVKFDQHRWRELS